MSSLQVVWEVCDRYETLSDEDKIAMWAGLALGMTDTVHHFIHGKKKGSTMFDCTDESCRLMSILRAKVYADDVRRHP